MTEELLGEAQLREAMELYGDAVYRLALCRLGNRADAEDVYQEVFLRLLRDGSAFNDSEHLKAWLLRVAISRCTDMRRTAWFKHTVPLESARDAATDENFMQEELWRTVSELPEKLRTPVYLHYVEGYGTDEIAAMLGCRPATVRTRLHRARKQLKIELEEDENEKDKSECAVRIAEH